MYCIMYKRYLDTIAGHHSGGGRMRQAAERVPRAGSGHRDCAAEHDVLSDLADVQGDEVTERLPISGWQRFEGFFVTALDRHSF